MSLFSSYGQTESNFARVGDNGFVGIDARTAPDKLPEGVLSRAENVRMRTKEIVTRPGNPFINGFYPDNWPYDLEYSNGALTGTWNNDGLDADVTVDSGATSGTPYDDGYEYLRFDSGLVLKVTGEESGGVIPVETQFVASGQSVAAETFVWCKLETSHETWSDLFDMARSVITNAGQTPITTGRFSDPNSHEYFVVITATSAWFAREHNRPFEVTIPGGVDDTAYLEQAFDRLFLFRGTGQTVLDYTASRGTWAELTSDLDGTYTLPLPNAKRGVFFQNRMWVWVDDSLYFSDIGNPDRYYLLDNEVRINTGQHSDGIVAVFPFGKYALLIFTNDSIYALDNLYGNVATNMRLRQISTRVGCGSPDTIVNVGNRVWFCDQSGDVWDISQVDEERMEISGEPVSWPIRPAMEELGLTNNNDWAAAYYDGYYYLFFQGDNIYRDDAEFFGITLSGLNYVAVYDTINEAWVSIDKDAMMDMVGLPVVMDWYGDQRLLTLSKFSGNLRMTGYGFTDGTRGRSSGSSVDGQPYVTLWTRGYTADKGTTQQFRRLHCNIARRDADTSFDAYTDGRNEAIDVGSIKNSSTDRVEYMTWDTADWDPSNTNNDFNNPYRKDYTVVPSDSATGVNLQSAYGDFNLGKYQTYNYEQTFNATGNYCQLRIVNKEGEIKIKDIALSSRANSNLQGSKV